MSDEFKPRPFYKFDQPGTLRRPGPIGRLVRLALGVPLLFVVWRLLFFAEISDLRHIPFWSWALIAVWLFPAVVNIGFGLSWGSWRPRVVVLVATSAAALVGQTVYGSWDAFVLWWLLLPWMTYVAGHLGVSFVLAAALGTPGCEMRAVPHLVGLVTGRPRAEHYCPGFLDGLDQWETERSGAVRDTGETSESAGGAEGITSSGIRMLLVYGLPIVAINLTGNFAGRTTVAIVWPLAFLIMSAGCMTNAIRCRRVHCYFTGPLFLLAAVLSALQGLRVIDLGSRPWETIGYGTFALALVLYFGPETIWGKYFRTTVGE